MTKKYITLFISISFLMFGCASKQIIEVDTPAEKIETPEVTVAVEQILNMVLIESGVFQNSSPVNIASFYLGAYLVTQSEYEEVMGTNPSFFKGEKLPVENLTWIEAVEFCNRLSIREGLTPVYIIEENTVTWNRNANGYRLPTDIEWEYACRAGTTTPFNTGNSITTNQANFDGRFPYNSNIRMEYRQRTTPVGLFAANSWGLYDMHGNVWEWCWDGPNGSQSDNSTMQLHNSTRVIRGGAWSSSGRSLHSSFRSGFQPNWKNNYVGFRVAKNAK